MTPVKRARDPGTGSPVPPRKQTKQTMTANDLTPSDGEKVAAEDAQPIEDVTATIPNAGIADLELWGQRESTDVTVNPVRHSTAEVDVSIAFRLEGTGQAILSLSEDEALALMDMIQNALEVPSFEE